MRSGFIIAPQPPAEEGGGEAPAWFASMAHKEWSEPLSNTIASVADPLSGSTNQGDSGLQGVTTAWTGMGCDQVNHEIFTLANGGHSDYRGNEVYSCLLNVAAPAWTRRRDATASSGSGNLTKWPDGRPTSSHTSFCHESAEGRWFLMGMYGMNWEGGSSGKQWWEFDRDANDWIDLGANHYTGTSEAFFSGVSCYDPGDREVISFRDNNSTPGIIFQSLDDMSNATAAVVNNNVINTSDYFGAAVDPDNRILLIRHPSSYSFLRLNSTANKQASRTTLSVTGVAPTVRNSQMHWHPPSQAFITWDGGQSIRKLKPVVSGGVYTSAEWTTVSSGFSGTTPTSSLPSAGMYDKTQLLLMPDGNYALIAFPIHNGPVYVCKLTGGVV